MGDTRGDRAGAQEPALSTPGMATLSWVAAVVRELWGGSVVLAENTVYFDALEMPLSADLFFHCEKAY